MTTTSATKTTRRTIFDVRALLAQVHKVVSGKLWKNRVGRGTGHDKIMVL